MSRVSVIVPAHDDRDVVGDALRSVLAQTYDDWEVVVADDASADDTGAQAAAVSDRVRVVRADVNLGPAGARNLALEHATGELVAFLDADDWWEPAYLERLVGRLDADGLDVVTCDARIATGAGTFAPHTYYGAYPWLRDAGEVTVEAMLRHNLVYVSSLVRRAAGEAVGWFDLDLFGTEDYGLYLKLAEHGCRFAIVREPLAVYRQTDASISRDVARQAINNQKLMRKALERGRLDPRQQRIARSELRYNVALEAVAGAAWGAGSPAQRAARVGRRLPTVLGVALTRPDRWAQWLSAFRR